MVGRIRCVLCFREEALELVTCTLLNIRRGNKRGYIPLHWVVWFGLSGVSTVGYRFAIAVGCSEKVVHSLCSGVDSWWAPLLLHNWGFHLLTDRGRDNVIVVATCCWLDVSGFGIPVGAGHVLFSMSIQTGHEVIPTSCAIGPGALSRGVKRPKCDDYQTPRLNMNNLYLYLPVCVLPEGPELSLKVPKPILIFWEDRGFDSRWCHWSFSLT